MLDTADPAPAEPAATHCRCLNITLPAIYALPRRFASILCGGGQSAAMLSAEGAACESISAHSSSTQAAATCAIGSALAA